MIRPKLNHFPAPNDDDRLMRIEALLQSLLEQRQVKDWYDIDEFARLVGKAPFTVREWARHGRIRAEKRKSGRGAYAAWVVSHSELQRYQREGLLPLSVNTSPVTRRLPYPH